MLKRGISAVLASVWIVFLMAVIVSFTWLFVIPLIGEGPIAVEAASLEIVQEGYTAWDPINRLAEIQVKRGNDSAEIEGFDLIFELSEKTLNHSVRQEISLNSKNVYYFNFSEISGTLEEVKLFPVYKNGKKGEVVSILKISNVVDVPIKGVESGKKYVNPETGEETGGGSEPGEPGPIICNPTKTCEYYYDLNQCGNDLFDGCEDKLDCIICDSGKSCNLPIGVCEVGTCVPKAVSVTCAGRGCGSVINNCGTLVSCGSCTGGKICNSGQCVVSTLPSGFIAYYRFENDANDETGNNHGVINGNPYFFDGMSGKAISLSGDDYVNVGTFGSFGAENGQTQMQQGTTVSAWVKTSSSDKMAIFGQGSVWNPAFSFFLNTNQYDNKEADLVFFNWRQSANSGSQMRTSFNIDDNKWHNIIVATKLSATSSQRVQEIWVDGIKRSVQSSRNDFSSSGTWSIKDYGLGLGANTVSTGPTHFFKGLIDELIIYPRSLSSSEITTLYNSQLGSSSLECLSSGDCCSNNCVNNKCVLTEERDSSSNCNDGFDNDCDGQVDSSDSGCFCSPPCGSGQTCYDGGCKALSSFVTANSVKSNNVTLSLNGNYKVGQFVNGDYWILDEGSGVNVASVTPDDGVPPAPKIVVNPSMYLPGGISYDIRNLRGGQSLVIIQDATGFPSDCMWDSVTVGIQDVSGICHKIGTHMNTYRAAVFTILSSIPPENSFRPPLAGNEKPLISATDLRTDLLPKIEFGSKPSVSNLNKYSKMFQGPWLDYLTSGGEVGREFHPAKNMPVYGRELAGTTGDAALLLAFNYPDADKRNLLINYVQTGIDEAYALKSGTYWNPSGQHGPGRKIVILFAGWVLENDDIKNVITNAPRSKIAEDGQTFYVTEHPVPSSVWTFDGSKWVSDGTDQDYDIFVPNPNPTLDPNPSLFDAGGYRYNCKDGRCYFGHCNTANQEELEEYLPEHRGMPEWGIAHAVSHIFYSGLYKEGYSSINAYRLDLDYAVEGAVLASHIYGLKESWGNDALFDYMDRMLSAFGNSATPISEISWNALRNNYGCKWVRDDTTDKFSNGHYDCSGVNVRCDWQASTIGQLVTTCSQYPNQRAKDYDPCNVC